MCQTKLSTFPKVHGNIRPKLTELYNLSGKSNGATVPYILGKASRKYIFQKTYFGNLMTKVTE